MKNITALTIALLFASCTKHVVREQVLPSHDRQVLVRTQGDTATYLFEFPDRDDRRRFSDHLENFIADYPFGKMQRDTVRDYVVIRTMPGSHPGEPAIALSTIENPTISETEIPGDTLRADTAQTAETEQPGFGGSASIYSPREFLDAGLLSLVTPSLCTDDTSQAAEFLRMETPGHGRMRLSFARRILNGQGQPFSAFDLADAWTAFIKVHPAEGRALFLGIKGINEFIKGGEAIVPGIQVADEKSIVFQFAKGADSASLAGLCTRRMIPAAAKMGPYFIVKHDGNVLNLQANVNYAGGRPFLDKCRIVLGKDANPLVGFSLNKYDVAVLNSTRDLAYARDRLRDSVTLTELPSDRYFIALGDLTPEVRRAIAAAVRPDDILSRFIKCEGQVISGIQSESQAPGPGLPVTTFQQAVTDKPLSILFRADDPVSVRIGEKLMAELSHAGMPCEMKSATATMYETALIDRAFAVAVGWAPQRVLTDPAEQFRLATLWFGGERLESKRLAENAEIPLFAVRNYALSKKHLALYRSSIAGLYSKNAPPLR